MTADLLKFLPALALASTLAATQTYAQSDESSWKPLENEPSTGELFRDFAQVPSTAGQPQVFVFPYSFQFPTSADRDVDGTARVNSYFGIDISHHNGINFPLSQLRRQHVAFVYTKATQGTDYADKTFGARWEGIKSLPESQRVPRGAYHFLSSNPGQSGKAQADRFLAYVALHGGFEEGDMRPALDLEWDRQCSKCPDRWIVNKRTPEEIIAAVREFVARVKEKSGWTPLIYTNKSFLNDVGISKAADIQRLLQSQKAWIFDLAKNDRTLEIANPANNLPYVLWQFSWGGSLSNGDSGQLDVDSFKGTWDEFRAAFLTMN